jgi:hypothetical protein
MWSICRTLGGPRTGGVAECGPFVGHCGATRTSGVEECCPYVRHCG